MMETPVTETPIMETPLEPMAGTESELPNQWNQTIPEGYDPAYPIEFPGADFKGYYPVDGEIVAPPSKFSGATSSSQAVIDSSSDAEASSSDSETPTVPSVVIGSNETDIVMPEPGQIDDTLSQSSVSAVTADQSDDQNNEMMAVEAANQNAESELVRTLKQKLQAANLRAREAEEKALAIARQASEDQKQLDQMKAQTAESNSDIETVESQGSEYQQQVEQLTTKLAESDQAVNRMKSQAAKNQKRMKQLKAKLAQSNASIEQMEARNKKSQQQQANQPKIESPAETGNLSTELAPKKAEGDSKKAAKNKASNQARLLKKVTALETARDKQLASAAARIESDFQGKIDAKLDEGKTEEHPEVKSLKESMQTRLKESDTNIRRRYKRQINKIWKEAAARSRS